MNEETEKIRNLRSYTKNSGDLHHEGEHRQRLSTVARGGQHPEFQIRWKDIDRKVIKYTKCGERETHMLMAGRSLNSLNNLRTTDTSYFSSQFALSI